MRKINLLLIICTLYFARTTHAQEHIPIMETEKGIKLNVNAGFHFSNMTGRNVQKDDDLFIGAYSTDGSPYYYDSYSLKAGGYNGLLSGYKFGIGITFDITNYFAWGVDLNFETKGCRIPIKEIIYAYNTTTTYPIYTSSQEIKRFAVSDVYSVIRMNYLVIPIKTEFKYKKFYFMPGLYTAFLLDAPNTTKLDDKNHPFIDNRYNVASHYTFIDLGVFVNTGFCFPLSKRDFIRIGVFGEWNVSGTQNPFLAGGGYSFFCNQVFGIELKYEIKIK